MNREQRRKEQKLKGKSGIQNAYLEKAKEVNKAYSECTDEILNIYNQWVGVSFKSEKEFLDIIDDNDLTICVSENESATMCWFEINNGERKVGETFISQSLKEEDVINFRTELALILLHIASICNNENNKNVIKKRAEGLI